MLICSFNLLPSWSFSICSIVIQFWSLFKRDDKVYAFEFLTWAELPFASLGELI